jgi:hypothetical protein
MDMDGARTHPEPPPRRGFVLPLVVTGLGSHGALAGGQSAESETTGLDGLIVASHSEGQALSWPWPRLLVDLRGDAAHVRGESVRGPATHEQTA